MFLNLWASDPHPKKDNENRASSMGLLLESVSALERSGTQLSTESGTTFLLPNNRMLYNNNSKGGAVLGHDYLGHG